MKRELLAEFAHLFATEGLEGERLREFEEWRAGASAAEKEEFARMLDSIALLSVAGVEAVTPSPGLKEAILGQVGHEHGEWPEGHDFLASDEGTWQGLPVKGVRIKELSAREEDGVTMFLLEMAAGTRFPAHRHHGVEMVYVLEGDLDSDGRVLHRGDFLRAGAGSDHGSLSSRNGCRALLVTATENFPRRTVGLLSRFSDAARAFRDVWRSGRN